MKMMTAIKWVAMAMVGFSTAAIALDASGQRYATMLASGGLGSMQHAAEEIYNQGLRDQELLDVAAETLAQNYTRGGNGETFVDSVSWLCKALGNSGNGRYRELLVKVSESDIHRKAKKYCDKAADSLPKNVPAYVVGTVNLSTYKDGGASAAPAAAQAAPAQAVPRRSGGAADFSQIREGMSQQEVEDLIGPPTATTGHVTGKAFAPFNYRGKDTVRMYALYKGVGKIIYSNDNRYSGVYRVREIVVDAGESGYP